MGGWIKDQPCRVDSIYNDNKSDILEMNSLINATSDGKQFCFSKSNCYKLKTRVKSKEQSLDWVDYKRTQWSS